MIDDYEVRNKGYWGNPEEYMYQDLEDRWRSESYVGFNHSDETYSNRNLLLNTLSENIFDWNHYFAIPKFSSAKVESLKGKHSSFLNPVLDWFRVFKINSSSNLIFVGSNGTGKTHAAFAACRFVSLHGVMRNDGSLFMPTCRFLDCVDAHNFLDGWNKKIDVEFNINQFKKAGVLLVDDLGAVATSAQSSIANIVSIVAYRYNSNLPTVITSNVKPDELVKLYGSTSVRRMIQENSLVHYS